MKKYFIYIFSIFLSAASNRIAQQRIVTDRPDQTDGTYTVPVNAFQLENGVLFSKEILLNNFMLRYGVGKTTELRLAIDAGKNGGLSGLQPVTLSLKQRFLEQHGALPAVAFIGDLSFGQLASKPFQVNEIPFALKLAFDNDLSKRCSIGYNIGTSNEFRQLDLTAEGGYSLTETISIFLEYFSNLYKGGNDHYLDGGFLFGLTPNFQLDLAGGIALKNSDTPYFCTIGVSFIF